MILNPGESGVKRLTVEEREWHLKPREVVVRCTVK